MVKDPKIFKNFSKNDYTVCAYLQVKMSLMKPRETYLHGHLIDRLEKDGSIILSSYTIHHDK